MSSPRRGTRQLTRRELLATAAVAVPSLAFAGRIGASVLRPGTDLAGMNVVLFLSDQERALQHFPKGWAQKNLPGLTRLQQHGLTFERAFTNACMCSPARSTLMTGFFPAQHGVKYTLEEDMPAGQYPQVELPLDLPNMASVMASRGYTPVYKGKWHLDKPEGATWTPADVQEYGFKRWDPPDGGANQDISEAGGGTTNHDGRYMDSVGSADAGAEGVLQYINSHAAQQQPFFLVVSLINPHDVLLYPKNYLAAGYDDSWLEGTIGLPPTVNEDLSTKPTVQRQFLKLFNLTGPLRTPQQKRSYLNFYGNLMKATDAYLVKVLDALATAGLLDDTLVVRTSDHGEMGLAHGGLRQKNFNVYEEATRVPLVYSNPRLFPRSRRSSALVSHVDFLPTLASLFAVPRSARTNWQGVDYSRIVLGSSTKPRQSYVVFTYDDFQSGQARGPYPSPPNHIVSIREQRWKIARYYDPAGKRAAQWELYDLKNDPNERKNLAWPGVKRTPLQEREFQRMKKKLARVQKTRLRPLAT